MRRLRSAFLALLLLPLAACTSAGGTDAASDAPLKADAGRLKERALAARAERERAREVGRGVGDTGAAEAGASEPEERGVADRGAFDFGTGPIRRKRRPAADREPAAAPADGRGAARDAAPAADEAEGADRGGREPTARRAALAGASGKGIRVTWEALAVEREQVENPRFGRRQLKGVQPDLKLVLVSPDHPEALSREAGRAATRDAQGAQVAVLAADEMGALVKALDQIGFRRVSLPTGSAQGRFDDPEARGRVTVEVDGESRTVLSMRGQGGTPATRDIPRVYSEAKQAIAALRNRTPTLNVVTAGGQVGKPRVVPRKRGESRVLTDAEAAEILGPDGPAKPVEDVWGLGR